MNKLKDILFIYSLILIEFLILSNTKIIYNSTLSSSKIFILKIFPFMFPSMVIGNILTMIGLYKIIPNFINKLFKYLFNFNMLDTSIFLTSIFTGSPSNALFINECLNNNIIKEKEAENLLCVTNFINPLYIMGSIGLGIFNSYKIGLLLILLLIISNLFKAYLLRNNFSKKILINNNNISYINIIFKSIKTAINSSLMIFGIIIMFNILLSLINNVFNLSLISDCILNLTIEITSGIVKLSSLNINNIYKFILAYYFINFSGLCIHMQVLSQFKNKKIRYLKYLIFRLF